ncbi:MAG: hypothetical protein IIC69_00240 [Nanoarchaeota archaeon]|nr:hypothetical protein [Nanoarchaeota archaeon]
MQITYLNYFLASIIAYLGLLLGIILIKLAAEEQQPGKRYFILLKKILFFMILVSLLFFYKINVILTTILLFFIIILMLNKKMNLEKSSLVYLLLGVIFYLSSKIFNLFVLETVLIFLYGVANSSILLNLKKKNYYGIILKNLWFFVPIIVLYVLL